MTKLHILSGVLLMLLLAGCSTINAEEADWEPSEVEEVNTFEGVSMKMKEGSVSSKGATVVIKNDSDREVMYGNAYILEKKVNGEWFEVPITVEGEYGFTAIGYTIAPGSSAEKEMEWDWLYGELNKGEYRILKGINYSVSENSKKRNYLAVEFTIK
ncbi:immunoglobulin-like domain-containing protein [Jeotgalibacillus terrae]|uniref:Immunoglobulin-like domain-containing protein n=1 Tax=Jeotgalibacillus terrae TaxID=587735 RepID=A0ABW5ZD01_9BACL|nr:immunoglobulin-like domain-containing protein [Jeotgalibacillus terrae]MBM7577835.1 putative lipoprotein [Jeotgalibacillus terrae]